MGYRISLKVAVMATTPLLMAPLCRSVYPNWPVSPPAPYNVDASFNATKFRTNAQYVETNVMASTHSNGVVALGLAADWDNVEPCDKCPGGNCTNPPVSWPVGWPTANDVSGRHLETLGADSYRCNFNFAYLDAYLDTHVDPYGSRTAYRSFEIQLAPEIRSSKPVLAVPRRSPPSPRRA